SYCNGGPITNYAPPVQPGAPALPNYRASPFFPNSFLTANTPYGPLGINRFTPFIMPDQLQPSSQKVDFWRANAGLRGDLGLADWRYDGNVQLSRTRANQKLLNPTITTMQNVLM